MFRSLKRDEVYRYGVVYYNKYGQHTDVQWIGDIRTPSLTECPNFKYNNKTQVSNNTKYKYSSSFNADVSLARKYDNGSRPVIKNKYSQYFSSIGANTSILFTFDSINVTIIAR
uniref:Stabilization protein n=1 Tax=Dulem virus 42 TaxID=3145760 RepID=A0AAU8BB62_9CAUD